MVKTSTRPYKIIYTHLNLRRNAAFPLELRRIPVEGSLLAALHAITRVGLPTGKIQICVNGCANSWRWLQGRLVHAVREPESIP